jgi:hypothetical protein
VLSDLIDDTLDVLDLAEGLVADQDEDGTPLEGATERAREAMSIFYEAAKRLAATPMEALKDQGLETSFSDGALPQSPLLGHCLDTHTRPLPIAMCTGDLGLRAYLWMSVSTGVWTRRVGSVCECVCMHACTCAFGRACVRSCICVCVCVCSPAFLSLRCPSSTDSS